MLKYGKRFAGVLLYETLVIEAPYVFIKSSAAFIPLTDFIATLADVDEVENFIMLSASIPVGEFLVKKPTVSWNELKGEYTILPYGVAVP